MNIFRRIAGFRHSDSTHGNVLITVIIVVTIMTVFGGVMVSRMILDAHAAVRMLNATRAYDLADSGIEWGLRYLTISTSNTTLGALSIGGGSVTVSVQQTTVYYTSSLTSTDVYQITSTATVANCTRQIEELRYRGGGSDKKFFLYHEVVADEF